MRGVLYFFFVFTEVQGTFKLKPLQPKVFGVKFSLREIRKVFPIKLRNFKLREMPKLLNFRFPEGRYFLNCDNTELKRSSGIIFSFAERHRWEVVGYLSALDETLLIEMVVQKFLFKTD